MLNDMSVIKYAKYNGESIELYISETLATFCIMATYINVTWMYHVHSKYMFILDCHSLYLLSFQPHWKQSFGFLSLV